MEPLECTIAKKRKLVVHGDDFQLIARQLYKMGPDEILHRCLMEKERPLILMETHDGIAGAHYVGKETT